MKLRRSYWLLSFAGLLIVFSLFISVAREQQEIRQEAAASFPRVSGTKIVDASGKTILLRGAQIETAFNVANAWKQGSTSTMYPPKLANPQVFAAMAAWHMNVVRLPIGNWIYSADKVSYLHLLDQIVTQANQAGLYVVLDLHDDSRAGSPYADPGNQLRVATSETVAFWKDMAAHYKSNPMVFYDLLNEPYEYADWNTWLHGGSMVDTAVSPSKTFQAFGLQDMVNAIRSTGSQQIVIVESWQQASQGSFNTIGTSVIHDPNVVYSWHTYVIANPRYGTPAYWNSQWGPLLGHYPLYVGEWAFLPNAYHPFMCSTTSGQTYSATQGTQAVNNFLSYLSQNSISWTAWQFDQYHLVKDETSFGPTSLSSPAEDSCCGQGPSASCNFGMGSLLKNFLASAVTPTPSVTGKPTAAVTPTHQPTPTPTRQSTPTPFPPGSTILSFSLLLDGVGNAGDSTNPASKGNPNPAHPQRTVYVSVYDRLNKLIGTSKTQVFYNAKGGDFSGQIAVNTVPTGSYIVKIKADQYLRKMVSGIQTITAKKTTQLPTVTLVAGDVNGDNILNILDYNILMGCYSDLHPAVSCTATQKLMADLNDDTKVNQVDYNLFIRELGTRGGD